MYPAPTDTSKKQKTQADAALGAMQTKIMRLTSKTRDQLAAEITADSGLRVTRFMLDAWTAGTKRWARFPLVLAQSFAKATGSNELEKVLLPPERYRLLLLGEAAAEVLDERAQRQLIARKKAGSQ